MGKIGEFEETVIAEPLNKPLPQEQHPLNIPEEPVTKPVLIPK